MGEEFTPSKHISREYISQVSSATVRYLTFDNILDILVNMKFLSNKKRMFLKYSIHVCLNSDSGQNYKECGHSNKTLLFRIHGH